MLGRRNGKEGASSRRSAGWMPTRRRRDSVVVRCGATAISRAWLTEIRHYDITRAVLKPYGRTARSTPHTTGTWGVIVGEESRPDRSRPTGHPFSTDATACCVVPRISHALRRNGVRYCRLIRASLHGIRSRKNELDNLKKKRDYADNRERVERRKGWWRRTVEERS